MLNFNKLQGSVSLISLKIIYRVNFLLFNKKPIASWLIFLLFKFYFMLRICTGKVCQIIHSLYETDLCVKHICCALICCAFPVTKKWLLWFCLPFGMLFIHYTNLNPKSNSDSSLSALSNKTLQGKCMIAIELFAWAISMVFIVFRSQTNVYMCFAILSFFFTFFILLSILIPLYTYT